MLKIKSLLQAFIAACFLFTINFSQAATFTVNTLDNTDDGTCDAGHCSLQEAINEANANPGADIIVFSTGGTINLGVGVGSLPLISGQVDIDGAGITLSGAPNAGLEFINGAANSVVQNITINGCLGGAIAFIGTPNFAATNCMLIGNGTPAGSSSGGNGLNIQGSSDGMISGNTISNNQENGVFFDNSNNLNFSNNIVQSNGFHGIVGVNANNAIFDGNTASNNGFNQPTAVSNNPSSSGIIVVNTAGCIITNNTVEGSIAESGILIVNASGCTITGNTACQNFKAGIWLIEASNNIVTGNDICNNSGANSPGILLQNGSSNNTIKTNNITANQGNGVQILSGNGNEITENIMSDNNDIGIGLSGGNSNAPTPVVNAFSCDEIMGTVSANSLIHVYEADPDSPCQGMVFLGTFGPFSGAFTIGGVFDASTTYAITATLTGSSASTSEFVCFGAICDDGCALTTDFFNIATCECEFTLPDCNDNCALTTDSFNTASCECENVAPDCNDNCASTTDSFNAASCECENMEPDCNDNCALTTDSFNTASCECENVVPDCDDNCALTNDFFNINTCDCVNEDPDCSDTCFETFDFFNQNTCECENIEPDCDDNCVLTNDFFNINTCDCVNEEPDCSDACFETFDFFNTATCECENVAPDCNDNCALTTDSFNTASCECENVVPDCNDNCAATTDSFNAASCECENMEPDCNDNCALTTDSFNTASCECENVAPDCNDNCALTTDSFNTASCECENVAPDCNDNCAATTDSFNAASCECENMEPDCDDNCALTTDSFNTASCECENVEPSCDDNCASTTDSFNTASCECENMEPDCDDNCALTTDSFNAISCECENLEPNPDDGCELTTDIYDAVNCTITNTPPNCDDNDCATTDSYDAANCACINDLIPPPAAMDAAANLCEEADGMATFNLLNLDMVVNMGTGNTVTWSDANGQIANPGAYETGSVMITAEISDNETPVCQTTTATVTLSVQLQPTAEVTLIATVCNTNAGGSILNLDALITDGDMSGNWTDEDGAGVDLSNTMSVDFDGVNPDGSPYTLLYTTNSAVAPCVESTYSVEVFVEDCSCPSVATNAPNAALCNDGGTLDLTTLEVTTEPGTWTITSPISNPPTITDNVFAAMDAPAGDYEITFTLDTAPPTNCPNTSAQTISIVDQPFAGMNAEGTFCNDEINLLVLADLLENEDANGTWAVSATSPDFPNGGAFDFANGTFNPTNHPAGIFVFNYTVENGVCTEAVADVTINLLATDMVFLQDFSCEMTEVGVDTVVLNNQFGCDSLVITTTDLLSADTTNLMEFTCNPDNEGMSEMLLTNQAGCDSLLIINTVFDAAAIDSTFVQDFTCDETMIGTIENILQGSDGCDSIVFTTTDLLSADTTNLMEFTCNPDNEGMSEMLLTNQAGCDSLLIINTIFDAAAIDSTFVQDFTCDETMIGTIENTLQGSDGCDSIVFTTTDLLSADTTNLMEFTCNPDNEGMSEMLLTNQAGCDSLLIINTVFDAAAIDSTFVQDFTCDETMIGTIENTLQGSDGCDSIVFITTDLLSADTTNLMEFTCNPDNEGMSEMLLTNQAGCDSLLIINTVFDAAAIDSTFVQDFTCDETMIGTIENTLQGSDGCDSIVFITTDLLAADTTNLMEFTCNPNDVGMSEMLLQNQDGCDSLLIINTLFDANAIDTTIVNATTCDETMIGNMQVLLMGADGCDSLVITETTLGDSPEANILPADNLDCTNLAVEVMGENLTANPTTYEWRDETGAALANSATFTVNSAGVYTLIITDDISGCTDSAMIEIFELSELPTAVAGADVVLNCDGTPTILDAGASQPAGQLTYEWLDASGMLINQNSESSVAVMDIGIYELTVSDTQNGCSDTDNITVFAFEMVEAFADDFVMEINTEISGDLLTNDELNGQTVIATVENEASNGDLIIDTTGIFTFIPDNDFIGMITFDYAICIENCPEECSINSVTIEVEGESFVIPDAFSPNDDGINDTWVIPTIDQYPRNHVRVINRWGDILFEKRGYENDWGGTAKNGEDLPSGTYYYLLVLDLLTEETYEGTLTIVR